MNIRFNNLLNISLKYGSGSVLVNIKPLISDINHLIFNSKADTSTTTIKRLSKLTENIYWAGPHDFFGLFGDFMKNFSFSFFETQKSVFRSLSNRVLKRSKSGNWHVNEFLEIFSLSFFPPVNMYNNGTDFDKIWSLCYLHLYLMKNVITYKYDNPILIYNADGICQILK